MTPADLAHWQFRPLNPNENSGASTTDDNFADEERTNVEILVRETLQNPLDARLGDEVVRVVYRVKSVDLSESAFSRSIFSDDWMKHFKAGGLIRDSAKPKKMKFLIIEDFGTTGLEGSYTDSGVEGQGENWNAFWFREGEGAKPSRSNGGAGQGKITLYLASQLRSVFALTHRASDGGELLFGCCRFRRNYKLDGDLRRWAKEARWGALADPDQQAVPIVDEALISAAKTELGLRNHSNEAGTSFIVPMPMEEFTEALLLRAVVNEFYFAIRRGRLEVTVGSTEINKDTVVACAEGLGADCRLPRRFREFLGEAAGAVGGAPTAVAKKTWSRATSLAEGEFDKTELETLKSAFVSGEMVRVDFPISVRRRDQAGATESVFRVFLKQDEDLPQSLELFLRQDLGIDGERRLKSSRVIVPVMALTFIEDVALSELLVAAEEPTHRNWNARRPRVVAQYFSPSDVLNAVRNAALRLVQFIAPSGRRDETALAVFFEAPNSETKRDGGSFGNKPDVPGDPPPLPPLPEPKPKPVKVKLNADGFEVRAQKIAGVQFPIRCRVTLAYATVIGDPFRLWDAADFWVEDDERHNKVMSNIGSLTADLNRIEFEMQNEQSVLSVAGFDPNRQLVIRVKYEEVSSGTDHQDD
ncbi:MAG TPA: hypothetical protein PK788_01415 [Gemmatimonadaceae bacterium]|nr:hypothetical protein [Gemmatimonadaceae bacterium]